MAIAPPVEADVGLVFVHGIGTQGPTETLERMGRPLIDWTDRWLRGHARGAARGGPSVAETLDAPAHFLAAVHGEDSGSATWLVAESHWADAFPPPDFTDVARWGVRFGMAAIGRVRRHLSAAIGRAAAAGGEALGDARASLERGVDEQPGIGSHTGTIWVVVFTLVVAAIWAVGIVFLLVVILVTSLAVAALLLAVIPLLGVGGRVPGLRRVLLPVTSALAASVGDAYAILKVPETRLAITGRIARDLRWVSARSRSVVVVGHSQGAAAAVATLTDDLSLPCSHLMTVGGATSLLDIRPAGSKGPVAELLARRFALGWTNLWTFWDPVSGGPCSDDRKNDGRRRDAMHRQLPSKQEEESNAQLAEFVAGIRSPPAPAVERLISGRWISDIFLGPRADPTSPASPAGPRARATKRTSDVVLGARAGIAEVYRLQSHIALKLIPKPIEAVIQPPPPGPSEVMVHNRGSVLRDHSAYAQNPEQFLSRLAAVMGVASFGTWTDTSEEEALDGLRSARGRRVRELVIGWWAIVGTAGLLGGLLAQRGWLEEPANLWMSAATGLGTLTACLWLSAVLYRRREGAALRDASNGAIAKEHAHRVWILVMWVALAALSLLQESDIAVYGGLGLALILAALALSPAGELRLARFGKRCRPDAGSPQSENLGR